MPPPRAPGAACAAPPERGHHGPAGANGGARWAPDREATRAVHVPRIHEGWPGRPLPPARGHPPLSAPAADLQGPAGNLYDKYGTRNPLSRLVVGRFLRRLERVVATTATGAGSLLDVGCGEGVVTERLAALLPHVRVVGLDVDDPALARSWRERRGENLAFRPGSAYRLPFADGSFDVALAIEVLEHLERPEQAVAELARVARRGIVVSTPREPLWRAANVVSGRHLRHLGDTPGHVNHFSRRALRRLASRAGHVREVHSPFPWVIVSVELPGAAG